ncbi:KAE1 threonylcarbamoyltransferase, partial [Alcedo cyanopectus]|nr:KAE1 threonylcarbamoyltransferase [Ceyx cyanopectus]
VIAFSRRRYRILGETLDLALGNCLDRLARLLQVTSGHAHPHFRPRPPALPATPTPTSGHAHPLISVPTAPQRSQSRLQRGADGQGETAFAMLTEVTERAMALTRARHLLLVGGVAC